MLTFISSFLRMCKQLTWTKFTESVGRGLFVRDTTTFFYLRIVFILETPSFYRDIWTPVIGEKLIKDNTTVGHIPKEHSKNCSAALLDCGKIKCEVTGRLEVASKYIVTGPMFLIPKLELLNGVRP